MSFFAPALLFATLSVAAEPRPDVAEVGDAVRVTVSVAGTGLSQVSSVTPPKMPDGLEIGPAQGPKVERRVEIRNRQQIQTERLIWYFDLTATKPGTFRVSGFTASNGNDVATSLPFELRATGSFVPGDYAFVETRVDPRPRFVGEPITATVVIGVAEDTAKDLVDAESILTAPWLFDGLAGGGTPESDPLPAAGKPNVSQIRTSSGKALLVEAGPEEKRKSATFHTVTATRRFVATQPGAVTIGPTSFRAVIGRHWEQDLFGLQRMPRERKLALVSAPDVVIPVKPLPDAGRSDAFSGLVGRLALDVEVSAAGAPPIASSAPIKVKVGDSLRVKVRVSGEGNVSTMPLTRVEIDGFKRFGVVEEVDANKEPPRRTLVYDIAPVSTEVKQVPPFTFEIFDTSTGMYRQLSSQPVPLQVLPGAAISQLADATPAPVAANAPAAAAKEAPSIVELFPGGAAGIAAVLAAPALLFGAFAMIGRLRRKDPASTPPKSAKPAASARRTAVRAPEKRAASSSFADAMSSLPASGRERAKAIAEAFAHHLASLAGLAPEAFVGADLDAALAPYVKDRDLRREAQAIVDEAERAAWGGEALARDLADRAASVASRVERALVRRGG